MELPKSDHIDPEIAKHLYENHCSILVVEDLPIGSEFGIDLASFQIGEKFKGVKLIPPGIHFIFASAVAEQGLQRFGPRSGFFHEFKSKELVVRKWSPRDEDFDFVWKPSHEHVDRYQSNLRDLDRYLGAYRFSTYETFCHLTDHIKPDFIKAILPETGRVLEAEIRFTKIPTKHDRQINSPANMITEYHLDTSSKLEQITHYESGRERLLCECQLVFVTLILGHVYECFEHWKRLVELLCLADSALNKYPDFFIQFVRILKDQLAQVPEDMFEDIESFNNFIRCRLDTLFQNVDQCSNAALKEQVSELRKFAEHKFGWRFDLEDEDEQPVIVEL